MAASTATADLVERIHDLSRTPLDAEMARHTRARLLLCVADAVCGQHDSMVTAARELWSEHGGKGSVPVLGGTQVLDVLAATLVHGAAAYRTGRIRTGARAPDAAVMAAALSLGAAEDISGDRLLTGFALGCAMQGRLTEAIGATGDGHPWNPSHVCAPLAAAATASVLLDLTALQTRTALGIAAAQLLGHRVSDDTPLEPYLAGKGAANGVHAALLAGAGLTGAIDVLEHPRGFFAVVSPGDSIPASLLADLGDHWVMRDGLGATAEEARRQAAERMRPVLGERTETLIAAIDELPETSATRIVAAGTLAEVGAWR